MIHRIEKKTIYKIKAEKEYQRSHFRGELGVRIKNSRKSDPTADEAVNNVMLEEAFNNGKIEQGFLEGIENSEEYEAIFKTISMMKMDYELLGSIIDDLNERDSRTIKDFLINGKRITDIAISEDRTENAIKKRIQKIRIMIREDIVECLEFNSRGGE